MKLTRLLKTNSSQCDSLKLLQRTAFSLDGFLNPNNLKILRTFIITPTAKRVKPIQSCGVRQSESVHTMERNPAWTWAIRDFSSFCGRVGTPNKQIKKSKIFICQCRRPNSFFSSLFYSTNSSKMANVSAILKDQSALQVTKPARKKAPKISELGKTVQMDNVVAYAMAEEVDLESLELHLINQGLYKIGQMPQDVINALHVRGKYNVDQKPKEIFVFRDGSVVFWCVPEIERGAFMKMLSKYSVAPYLKSLVIYEREEMDIKFTNGKSGLVGEKIHLRQSLDDRLNGTRKEEKGQEKVLESHKGKEREEEEFHRLLEMYTFSNAMSQSVKLAIWEASLSKFVSSIVSVTDDLRHGNKIRMSRKQVLMKTGELFSLRHLINLSSDLLDTPDFYWDRGTLEPLYQSLFNHLNIARRTRVMNEKLSHCCELTELLSTQLNDAHHTRLEIMIIVLIMVEVVFECIHYAERYLKSNGSDSSILAASSSEV